MPWPPPLEKIRGSRKGRDGPYRGGSEKALAREVVGSLRAEMLCIADRRFFSYALWKEAVGTRADLLWRVPNNVVLPLIKRFEDGSYLSKIYPSPKDRKQDRRGVVVRVIEFKLDGLAHDKEGQLYRLVTTLLEPEEAPAEELAALYLLRPCGPCGPSKASPVRRFFPLRRISRPFTAPSSRSFLRSGSPQVEAG